MNNYGTGKWSDTWTFRTKRMTTLDEHENYNVFKIFPNPVEEEFYIKFKSELETDINIRIYDLLGNLVYQNNCISNNGWF